MVCTDTITHLFCVQGHTRAVFLVHFTQHKDALRVAGDKDNKYIKEDWFWYGDRLAASMRQITFHRVDFIPVLVLF